MGGDECRHSVAPELAQARLTLSRQATELLRELLKMQRNSTRAIALTLWKSPSNKARRDRQSARFRQRPHLLGGTTRRGGRLTIRLSYPTGGPRMGSGWPR